MKRFFNNTWVIHRRARKDRWASLVEGFRVLGCDPPAFFDAIEPEAAPEGWSMSGGAYGCLKSHLALLERARDSDGPTLILEDDVKFAPDAIARIGGLLAAVPADWSQLFIGGRHTCQPRKVSSGYWLGRRIVATHAYAVSPQGAAVILDYADALLARTSRGVPIDEIYATGMKEGAWTACCSPSPWIAGHIASMSDIIGTWRSGR